MKYLLTSILLIALQCNAPKKDENTSPKPSKTSVENTNKTIPKKEMGTPKVDTDKLVVVLQNPKQIEDVKALVKNSGLTWSKTAYNSKKTIIGVVEVPKKDKNVWIERLQNTGEFKYVEAKKEKTIETLIKKEEQVYLSLKKSPCFGDCPVYEVTIEENGDITYKGVAFVTEKGERKFQLKEEELKKIQAILAKKEFNSFQNSYDNPEVMDLSSTYITHRNKQVEIRLWNNIPKELVELHEYIEGLLLERKLFE